KAQLRVRRAQRRGSPRVRVRPDALPIYNARGGRGRRAACELPRRLRVLGERLARHARRLDRADRADVRPRAAVERPAAAVSLRHLPRAVPREPSAAPAGGLRADLRADLAIRRRYRAGVRGRYFLRTRNSTRRFLARPSSVLLFATGWVSP